MTSCKIFPRSNPFQLLWTLRDPQAPPILEGKRQNPINLDESNHHLPRTLRMSSIRLGTCWWKTKFPMIPTADMNTIGFSKTPLTTCRNACPQLFSHGSLLLYRLEKKSLIKINNWKICQNLIHVHKDSSLAIKQCNVGRKKKEVIKQKNKKGITNH